MRAAANSRVTSAKSKYPLTNEWADPYRAERIYKLKREVLDFLRQQYRHGKPILAIGSGSYGVLYMVAGACAIIGAGAGLFPADAAGIHRSTFACASGQLP